MSTAVGAGNDHVAEVEAIGATDGGLARFPGYVTGACLRRRRIIAWIARRGVEWSTTLGNIDGGWSGRCCGGRATGAWRFAGTGLGAVIRVRTAGLCAHVLQPARTCHCGATTSALLAWNLTSSSCGARDDVPLLPGQGQHLGLPSRDPRLGGRRPRDRSHASAPAPSPARGGLRGRIRGGFGGRHRCATSCAGRHSCQQERLPQEAIMSHQRLLLQAIAEQRQARAHRRGRATPAGPRRSRGGAHPRRPTRPPSRP